jgi:hypothetical protein
MPSVGLGDRGLRIPLRRSPKISLDRAPFYLPMGIVLMLLMSVVLE